MPPDIPLGKNFVDHRFEIGLPVLAESMRTVCPDLSVGDLVSFNHVSRNSGLILYRIDRDCPPRTDAVWGEYVAHRTMFRRGSSSRVVTSWVKPGTRTKIPNIRLKGCIEVVPVLQMLTTRKPSRHTVAYNDIKRTIKKVDVLSLGKAFADFQDFINSEAKRLSGT